MFRYILFLILPAYAFADSAQFPCGVVPKRLITKGEFFNRIRGGWEARPHSLPWQVKLFMLDPLGRGISGCGGTLVESGKENGTDLVITAAHCIRAEDWKYKFMKKQHVAVIVGAHDLTLSHEQGRYAVPIAEVVGHKWYKDEGIFNDIAMIKLAYVVPYTETTRPACLPKPKQELPYGVPCVTSGWGLTSYDKEAGATKLMMRTAVIAKHDECLFWHDTRKHLCTKGHGDNCMGDSGGPLVCLIDEQYTLFGVVSYGTKECTDTMFASVPTYIQWLRRNTAAVEEAIQKAAAAASSTAIEEAQEVEKETE